MKPNLVDCNYSLSEGAALLVLQVFPQRACIIPVHVHLFEQVEVGVLLLGEADDVVGSSRLLQPHSDQTVSLVNISDPQGRFDMLLMRIMKRDISRSPGR